MAKKMIDLSTLMQAIATAAGIEVPEAQSAKAPPPKKSAKAEQPAKAPRRPRREPLEETTERKRVDPKTVPVELRLQFSTCPHCGHTGPIGTDFGVRRKQGVLRKQSWCADCRSKTNYHSRERKYRTQSSH